ncbi:uncharacterized protein [Montipora capricornis]|uniref:uncharacterized protein n=1 Tax=Montipora capricornis TaxID=246305 RepID=UPI0035F1C62D
MTVSPTQEKIQKTIGACSDLLNMVNPPIFEVAKVIGILVSNFPGVELGPLHYRALEHDKTSALAANVGNYEASLHLSDTSVEELHWWVSHIPHAKRHISHGLPSVIIQSDASKKGWGAVFEGQEIGGRWTASEASRHINIFELEAAFFALKSFGDKITGAHVQLHLDNTTAVAYVNNMGGSKSLELNCLAIKMWDWSIQRDNWISAVHLAGKLNIRADAQSRNFSDKHEWTLHSSVFEDIVSQYPELNIDLFATRLNHKLPTYCSWKPDPEDLAGSSQRNTSSTLMANTVLVSDCSSTALQPTLDTFPRQKTALTSNTGATPTVEEAKPDGVSTLRHSFRQYNVSPEVTDIIMASWRSGTQKQYKVYLEKWILFCREREVNYCSPPISDALEFLMGLYAQGLGYSTLNTARSALSSILRISDCQNFGSHSLVVRFMKGVFETRKQKPKYDDIWDASKVLNYHSTLHPVKELSLKDLTLKVLMLLLLVTGQRGQSIHLMTLSAMKRTESLCQFQILNHTKTSKPGHSSTSITISEFEQDPRICPLTALQEYLDRIQGLRNGEQCLFISYVKPHRAVSRDTISRWAKSVLESFGIDSHKFSAHSTRAAAASRAKQKDVPLDVILAHVGWRSAETFRKFYDKPVTPANNIMACAILSQ